MAPDTSPSTATAALAKLAASANSDGVSFSPKAAGIAAIFCNFSTTMSRAISRSCPLGAEATHPEPRKRRRSDDQRHGDRKWA